MIMSAFNDLDNFQHTIYYESCPEFEEVRELCLSENGWLRDIYTKSALVLEKHVGYTVIYTKDTHEPVGMAGLFNDGRYPSNIARHLHREYLFPKFRQTTRQGIVNGFKLYYKHIVEPLNAISNFDACFVAVQNRYKKDSKGYWNIFSSSACKGMPGFKLGDGYLQTCPFNVQKCWQNYIYCEHTPGAWNAWQKQIIDHDTWSSLIMGD
jgi:hypothetical protein